MFQKAFVRTNREITIVRRLFMPIKIILNIFFSFSSDLNALKKQINKKIIVTIDSIPRSGAIISPKIISKISKSNSLNKIKKKANRLIMAAKNPRRDSFDKKLILSFNFTEFILHILQSNFNILQ